MTEITTCPTCGAKCTVVKKSQHPNWNYMYYFASYYPDLTKLREVYDEFTDLNGPCMRNEAFPIIMQTIKELLSKE